MAEGGKDSNKLAEILAQRKAARAQKGGASANPPGADPSSKTSTEDDEEARLMVSLGGCNVSHGFDSWSSPSSFSTPEVPLARDSSGVLDIDPSEIDMEGSDKVAQGALGILYKATWRGCEVAVKKPVDPRSAMDARLKEDFRKEVTVLSEVRHPNVVLLMAASLRPPNLCLVLEWCAGGSLFDLLHRNRGEVAKHTLLAMAEGMAAGLAFLHTASPPIVHRDIKSQNVLLDKAGSTAKLCDFGLAVKLSEAATTNAAAGTPSYMGPELFSGGAFGLGSDTYAFGVTLNEMFSREMPFGAMELMEVKDKVVNGERPAISLTCPRAVSQIIKECWAPNQGARPHMSEVLRSLRQCKGSL